MELQTLRTVIRPFRETDFGDLQEILGDSRTMEALEPAYTPEKTRKFLQTFCIQKRGALAVEEENRGKVIGYILFCPQEADVYEMGWIFNRQYWGRGLAYESCAAVLEYGFSVRKAHKIWAETIDEEKSVGLMEKLGMHPEGILRSHTRDRQRN